MSSIYEINLPTDMKTELRGATLNKIRATRKKNLDV
jgi:hypothetical protein